MAIANKTATAWTITQPAVAGSHTAISVSENSVTISPDSTQKITIKTADKYVTKDIEVSASSIVINKTAISIAASDPGNNYIENTAAVIPSGGYLTLSAGYIPATKIALSTLMPNDATLDAATGGSSILKDETAYDNNGELIIGEIPTYSGIYIAN